MSQPIPDDGALVRVARESHEPMLSRPTDTSPFGKCDDRIDVPVPSALKEIFTTLSVLEGKAMAAYVREVLEGHALRERERIRRIVQTYGGDTNGTNLG